jgi:hypothetical protein
MSIIAVDEKVCTLRLPSELPVFLLGENGYDFEAFE